MIVTFIPGARLTLGQPTLDTSFKIKVTKYTNKPGCNKYVQVSGNQLRLAGIVFFGGYLIRRNYGYIVDKSLLQIH